MPLIVKLQVTPYFLFQVIVEDENDANISNNVKLIHTPQKPLMESSIDEEDAVNDNVRAASTPRVKELTQEPDVTNEVSTGTPMNIKSIY